MVNKNHIILKFVKECDRGKCLNINVSSRGLKLIREKTPKGS